MAERVRVESGPFVYNGEQYRDGDELEVADSTLEHYPYSLEVTESGSDESANADESDTEETGNGYTRDELEDLEYDELSDLAMESDDESINGRSSREDIIDALAED